MKELFEQAAAGIARLKRNSEFIGSAWDSAPTPSQGRRGMHFRTEGGNGVADTAGIVLKNADDTFTRKYFTLGGTATDAGAEILFYPINGGGVQIATGVQRLDLVVPYACTITGWTLLADQSGSIVVDIWKDTYANYPPTVADTITASAKPTITTATKAQSSTLTGWTTSLTAGDVLRFNVDSVTTCTYVGLYLTVRRS